ncbi:MAG: glycosyltransferase, partial [Desulfobulbaceae bacterium]|nr:glycosyltransferase [Desulfobulbaceae bacterium]
MLNKNRKKKRILYHESGSGFGGSAVSLYRLVKYLDKKSFRPYVFVHGVGPRIEEIKKMNVSVDRLKLYHPIPAINDTFPGFHTSIFENFSFYVNFCVNTIINTFIFYKTIKRNNINLVHLNNGIFENFPALIASKFCGIPCISHVRGTEPVTMIEKVFGKWVKKVITLNSEMYNPYKFLFGADKVSIVFNGVDIEAFENVDKSKLRHDYQVPEDNFLVGTIARLVLGKGIPEYIKAAAEVIKDNKKATFFVIGDDPLLNRSFENDLKKMCSMHGLNSHVIFTGWRNDVIDLIAGLDLVVQFSTFPEGMSLTPIEAMALSKPVITSNVPGYTDTVEHGVTGFIVPSGDIHALSKRILEISMDRDFGYTLGNSGRKKVEAEFDVKKTVNRIQE